MSLILNIDTALDTAYVSIAKDGKVLQDAVNSDQREHGTFLQTAIQSVLQKADININEVDAVAVVGGPGSYTGLRVGMASAKGICYAIKKPLIVVSTLKLLTYQAIYQQDIIIKNKVSLFCPMVDARRMEVFTAIYDEKFNIILPPCSLILDESIFVNLLLNNYIYFFGNGAPKWQLICKNINAHFIDLPDNTLNLSELTYNMFMEEDFADVAYAEPLYIKEFYNS